MKGIYCFINKINQKRYIGQSIQIEERYNQHIRTSQNKNSKEYDSSFYRALRKYGIDNFDFKILTQNDNYTKEDLNELEIYYINKFDSYNNGYNETKGGQTSEHFSKLTDNQILELKKDIKNNKLNFTELANKYNVSISLISMINSGKVWNDSKEKYPLIDSSINRAKGEKVNTSLSSDEEIIEIRKKFVNYTLDELYQEYKEKYSFSGLKKIVYGVNHKHLPIYKKKEQKWYLNGSCIDYPG